MLTRVAAAVVLLMAALALVAEPLDAHAGGNPFGSVVCGQSYSGLVRGVGGFAGRGRKCWCAARRGERDGSCGLGTPGRPGAAARPTRRSGACRRPARSRSRRWRARWEFPQPPVAPAAPALPAPGVLAQLAVRYLRLPDPVIRSSPAPDALQLTELPTWIWVAPAAWHPQSKTAQVPGEAVTATATPVSAAWSDGGWGHGHLQRPGDPVQQRERGVVLADVRLHLRPVPAPGSPPGRTG